MNELELLQSIANRLGWIIFLLVLIFIKIPTTKMLSSYKEREAKKKQADNTATENSETQELQ